MPRPLLLIFSGFFALLFGCASYGFVDDSGHVDGEGRRAPGPPLHVETILAPAHLSLDTSRLRRYLIDELELAGLQIVGAGHGPALACSVVDHRNRGFGHDVFVEVELNCQLFFTRDEPPGETFLVSGMGVDNLSRETPLAQAALVGTRRAEESAVADAVSQLIPGLTDALQRDIQ